MAKNDQEEAFEKVLSANLTRSIEMLKYAEAKNAALLTFCSAWIISFLNILNSKNQISEKIMNGIHISLPVLALSAIILIFSVLPQSHLVKKRKKTKRTNLLYFVDIAKMDAVSYKEALKATHLPPDQHSISETFLGDIAEQIHAYSRVAHRKFRIFTMCALFTMLALAEFGYFLVDWQFLFVRWNKVASVL